MLTIHRAITRIYKDVRMKNVWCNIMEKNSYSFVSDMSMRSSQLSDFIKFRKICSGPFPIRTGGKIIKVVTIYYVLYDPKYNIYFHNRNQVKYKTTNILENNLRKLNIHKILLSDLQRKI